MCFRKSNEILSSAFPPPFLRLSFVNSTHTCSSVIDVDMSSTRAGGRSWGITPLLSRHELPPVYIEMPERRLSLTRWIHDHEVPNAAATSNSDPAEVAFLVAIAWLEHADVESCHENHEQLWSTINRLGSLFITSRPDARMLVADEPGYWIFCPYRMQESWVEARIRPISTLQALFDREQPARRFQLRYWDPTNGFCHLRAEASSTVIEVTDIEIVHFLYKPAVISLLLE